MRAAGRSPLLAVVVCFTLAVAGACGGGKDKSGKDTPANNGANETKKWLAKLNDHMSARQALLELRRLGDPKAITPLVRSWDKFGNTKNMLAAIIGLARQKPGKKTHWDKAMPALKVAVAQALKKLEDPAKLANGVLAADAMGEANQPDSVWALIDVLKATVKLEQTAPAQPLRLAAIRSLGSYSTPESVRALVNVLGLSPKKHHRRTFAMAADSMSRVALSDKGRAKLISAIKPLIKTMYKVPPSYEFVRRALVAIGPVAIRALMQVFKHESDDLHEFIKANKFTNDCTPTGWGPELKCRAMAEIQFRAAQILGDARAVAALPDLVDALEDEPLPALYDPKRPGKPLTQHHAILQAIAKIGNAKIEGKTVAVRLANFWRANKYPALQGLAIRVYAAIATETAQLGKLAGIYVSAKDKVAAPASATAYGLLARKGSKLKPFDTMINRYRLRGKNALKKSDEFAAKGKDREAQLQTALSSQSRALQRESEFALIQAAIGMRCHDDLACYATLTAVDKLSPKILALLVSKGLATAEAKEPVVIQRLACTVFEMKKWSASELEKFELPDKPCLHLGKDYQPVYWTAKQTTAASFAAAERAFIELSRRAPQANPQLAKLLTNFGVYTPALRDQAITAIYRNGAKPCKQCAARIAELLATEQTSTGMVRLKRQRHKTGTQQFIADAKVWRGLFTWTPAPIAPPKKDPPADDPPADDPPPE